MKKTIKYFVFAVMALTFALSFVSCVEINDDDSYVCTEDGLKLQYEEETKSFTVVNGHDFLGDKLVIPSRHNSIPIKKIAADAFALNINLVSVEIPYTVEKIEAGAFYLCSKLESIKLPDGIKEIAALTFSQCKELSSITIPESVEVIGETAFAGCDDLAEVVIPDAVKTIGIGLSRAVTILKRLL